MTSELLLGFDYGRKRIGVAVGETLTQTARPLSTLQSRHQRPDWAGIDALIEAWQPAALVVGEPRREEGEHPLARAVRRFSRQLRERYRLPVHRVDERLSSFEAERRLRGHRGKVGVDAVAAQVILETWLSRQ